MKKKTLTTILVILIILVAAYLIYSYATNKNPQNTKKLDLNVSCTDIEIGAEYLAAERGISKQTAIASNCIVACSRQSLQYLQWDCIDNDFLCYCK